MRTLPDHVFGHHRAAVVLVAQHDDVDVEFFGPLDDDVGHVVLGGLDQFAVHLDARRRELVDGVLDDLPLPDVGVVLDGVRRRARLPR